MKRLNIVFLLILTAIMLVSCGEIFELEKLEADDPKTLLTVKLFTTVTMGANRISEKGSFKLNGVLQYYDEGEMKTDSTFGSLPLVGEIKYSMTNNSKSIGSSNISITLNFNYFTEDNTKSTVFEKAYSVLCELKKKYSITAEEFTYTASDDEPCLTWGKTKIEYSGNESLFNDVLKEPFMTLCKCVAGTIPVINKYNLEGTRELKTYTGEFEDENGITYSGTATTYFEYKKGATGYNVTNITMSNFPVKKISVNAEIVSINQIEAEEANPAIQDETKSLYSDFNLVYDTQEETLVYNKVNKYSLPFMYVFYIWYNYFVAI